MKRLMGSSAELAAVSLIHCNDGFLPGEGQHGVLKAVMADLYRARRELAGGRGADALS